MDLRDSVSDKLDGSEREQLEGRIIKGIVEFFQSFAQGLPWILTGLLAVYLFGTTDMLLSVGPLKVEGSSVSWYGAAFIVLVSIGYMEYKNLHCCYPGD